MIKYIKLRYKLFLVFLIFWFLLQLNFRVETIIMGVLICWIVTELSHDILYTDQGYRFRGIRFFALIKYVFRLFYHIYKAGFEYISHLIFGHYEPVVFTVMLDVDDPVLLGIIANSITLTPGTISIDVDTKHYMITVMTLAKKGTTVEELEKPIHDNFERLLKEKRDNT